MEEKSLGRVRRTEARLVRKEKVVGIEMSRQLIMDMFLKKLTGNRKKGDRTVVRGRSDVSHKEAELKMLSAHSKTDSMHCFLGSTCLALSLCS